MDEFNPFDEKYTVKLAGGQNRFDAQIENIKNVLSQYVELVSQRDEHLREAIKHTKAQLEDVDSHINAIAKTIAAHEVAMLRSELVNKGIIDE